MIPSAKLPLEEYFDNSKMEQFIKHSKSFLQQKFNQQRKSADLYRDLIDTSLLELLDLITIKSQIDSPLCHSIYVKAISFAVHDFLKYDPTYIKK